MQPCLPPLQRFLFPFLVVLCSFSPPCSYVSPFPLPQLLTPLSLSPSPIRATAYLWGCVQGLEQSGGAASRAGGATMRSVRGAGRLLLCLLPAILRTQAGGEAKPRPPPCQQVRLLLPEAVTALCAGSQHPSLCAAKGRSHMPLPHGTYLTRPPLLPVLSLHLPAPLCSPGFKLFAHSLSQLLPVTFKPMRTFPGGRMGQGLCRAALSVMPLTFHSLHERTAYMARVWGFSHLQEHHQAGFAFCSLTYPPGLKAKECRR